MKVERRNNRGAGFDEFGNPAEKAYDLGGVDDDRLRGERILFCVAYEQEDVRRCAKTLVQPAVAARNLMLLAASGKAVAAAALLRINFRRVHFFS